MIARAIYPRELVHEVFLELLGYLDPAPALHRPRALAERVCGVGGYRRRKAEMKDLELLYIPKISDVADPLDMFGATRKEDLTTPVFENLLERGILEKRISVTGNETWGPLNKHARHVATGLAIDLFAASEENWFNRLVVTTGPAELNIRIATQARAQGWEWEVYQAGFVPRGTNWENAPKTRRTMRSESEVFTFVGMEFLPPVKRK
jgi:DNA polymerase/3'-5' exonuclease PolX